MSTPWRSKGAPRCTTIDDAMCDGNVIEAAEDVAKAHAPTATHNIIMVITEYGVQ